VVVASRVLVVRRELVARQAAASRVRPGRVVLRVAAEPALAASLRSPPALSVAEVELAAMLERGVRRVARDRIWVERAGDLIWVERAAPREAEAHREWLGADSGSSGAQQHAACRAS
jgi:hypothetical protein